jgi:hypothetical protein
LWPLCCPQAEGARAPGGDEEAGAVSADAAAAAPGAVRARALRACGARELSCPMGALLAVLASLACAGIGVWLLLDDQHVPLTPSCADPLPAAGPRMGCSLADGLPGGISGRSGEFWA